jgi:conjugative relaxase-like TrwC/TraI family protein
MIRITQQKNAKAAKRCYLSAEYFREGRGMVGSWGGKGASRLGLNGTVDSFSFCLLCDNLRPRSGTPVTVRMRSKRTVGYNFIFSVSKSVSLLHAISGDHAIVDAFRLAVDETMRDMEGEMKTRVRKGKQDSYRTTGNMVWAEFIHTTSSRVHGLCDPQLQVRVFVFNMTLDEEEECWKAGVFSDLKRDGEFFQAAFRVRLVNKLQDLGFGVERNRDDFEIAGIPSDVLKRFSRRTALIEKLVRQREITDPTLKSRIGPKTRERKGTAFGLETRRREWRKRLTGLERQLLESVYRRETPYVRQDNGETLAVDHAIEHCFMLEAEVLERDLLTEALKCGIGAVTVEDITRELRSRPLIWSDVAGRKMATLKAH